MICKNLNHLYQFIRLFKPQKTTFISFNSKKCQRVKKIVYVAIECPPEVATTIAKKTRGLLFALPGRILYNFFQRYVHKQRRLKFVNHLYPLPTLYDIEFWYAINCVLGVPPQYFKGKFKKTCNIVMIRNFINRHYATTKSAQVPKILSPHTQHRSSNHIMGHN